MAASPPDPRVNESPEGILVSTQVSAQGKVTQRSIKDADQAWRMFEEIERQNQTRNDTDAIIWNKYSGGQPFDPVALRNTGQGERYNFPTGFMSAIVDKVTPVPSKIIDTARYLTSASLCDYNYQMGQVDPSKGRKTEVLRDKVTQYIRRWPEWKTFYIGLSQELVLIGRAFALRLDPFTPWPKFFRTDQAFLPNGTGEHARSIQVITARQDYLVHELVNFIRDKENSPGWKLENCVKAINEALPKQLNDDGSVAVNARSHEDCVREGNMGSSYSGATVIPVAHVWAVEPNDNPGSENKVTHYILYRKGLHEVLFEKEDRYDRIEDVATLFTLEPGNGKFYGSKGLGRKLINKHLAIERMRNRLYDQLEMAGLVILKTDAARAPTVQFKVRHPFILTTTDAEFSEQVVEANVKAYMDADNLMRDWTQNDVGQYLPSNMVGDEGGREKTAREATIDFQREAEAKVAFLSRFWGQFADLISMMQRALLDPDSTDKSAKELQQELRESGITREEMNEFANAPAAEVVQDLTQIQNSQIALVAAKYTGNPQINQRELMIRDISGMTSPAVAAALVLPEQLMMANAIEQSRAQSIETESIMSTSAPSQGVPVSPRDDHEIHLKTVIPYLGQQLQGLAQTGGANPLVLGNLSALEQHAQGHIDTWLQVGADPKQVKPYKDTLAQIDQQMRQVTIGVAQQMNAANEAQGQMAAMQAAGPPPPQPIPPQVLTSMYKDAPEKIKRQIEQQMGFQPPTDIEMAQEHARQATLKHPDLPEKVAQAAQNPMTEPGPPPTTVAPITEAQETGPLPGTPV